MAFDYSKLRGRIVEKFGSQTNFASHLGIAKQTVSAKLNGTIGLTRDDIITWSTALGIESSEIGTFYFNARV